MLAALISLGFIVAGAVGAILWVWRVAPWWAASLATGFLIAVVAAAIEER